jgi:hypothetical protein
MSSLHLREDIFSILTRPSVSGMPVIKHPLEVSCALVESFEAKVVMGDEPAKSSSITTRGCATALPHRLLLLSEFWIRQPGNAGRKDPKRQAQLDFNNMAK